jgi:uncharacterized membrane protein YidH (DUF202 family)
MDMDNESNIEFSLSNQLAIDRTNLGNKRTLFASIRTSIGLFGVAAALLKLFQHDLLHYIGHLFTVASVLMMVYGIKLYTDYHRYLNRISNKNKHMLMQLEKEKPSNN